MVVDRIHVLAQDQEIVLVQETTVLGIETDVVDRIFSIVVVFI